MASLTFLGAAGTVTGSKYLLEHQGKRMMVDCGLFQGLKELRLLNWEAPSFDPASVDAILLTHGHMDHTGYLPRLVRLGFRGAIYGTELTLKIAKIILMDSAKIQEEEAERANREGYSKHKPALALYTVDDVRETVKLFKPVKEGVQIPVMNQFKATFLYNGHILGSTFIEIESEGKTWVFSGDIGREEDLLLYPPKKPSKADLLLIESTYGGRVHPDEFSIFPELEKVVSQTIERGGTLLIPSFAVERTQLVMVMLWKLVKEGKIPRVPMIMDSPMGANVLDLFRSSKEWHRLSTEECDEVCSYFTVVESYKETMKIRTQKEPKIIIAGSGMMTGGRILSYLEVHGPNEKDTLLFVGYQAEGTRGWRVLNGEKTLKMFGKWVPIKLQVRKIEGMSAHADQNELLAWLGDLPQQPKQMFLIHGEKDQLAALQAKLKEAKDWDAQIPALYDQVNV
ncbi:MAG: MBL fold metallo-hydrolase RNA specificity domain-containing protein [Parachlamydiaceae bacterium]